MAIAAQTPVKISDVLNNVTPKWIPYINAWIRDFPSLSYVWLYLPNYYKDGGVWKNKTIEYTRDQSIRFKNIGTLETDMSINKNEVVWYEAWMLLEEALVTTANNTPSTSLEVEADKIRHFKVGDVVVLKPKVGSTTPEIQTEITWVNLTTNIITLNDATKAEVWDRLVLAYNLIEFGTKINRWVSTSDIIPVKTYFQTFGESVELNSEEINQTRLFIDAQEYINSKFGLAISMCNNRIARAWYLGRNIPWTKSETQWLFHVINEAEARFGTGSAKFDLSNITDPKIKAKELVKIINYANSAPVYIGNEWPTAFCNELFITSLSQIMFDMSNYFTLKDKEVEFGLQAYSSPYFRNMTFIVDHTLNRLETTKSFCVLFPKHLVTFKTPEYQTVDQNWALVRTQMWKYNVLKLPQESVDIVWYTVQLKLANVFGWQTYKWAYVSISGL